MTRPIVVFHANCPDGMAAAWAVNLATRDLERGFSAEFRPWRYDDPPLSLEEAAGREVIIADFSFKRTDLQAIHDVAKGLIVLDHHKTAQAELTGLKFCIFDMERSGAGLAWDHFHTGPRPWLIDYVEDRDLWRHKLPMSREVGAAIYELPFGEVDKTPDFAPWFEMANNSVEAAAQRGRCHLQTATRMANQIAANAQLCTLGGHICWVASAPVLFSEVAGMLAERPSAASGGQHFMGAVCYQRADGRWVYSLRSRSGFDCSEVAKKFRGGGHAQAAGFVTDTPVHHRLQSTL